ncbi:unnamed protein product, partial [Brenthis ino]
MREKRHIRAVRASDYVTKKGFAAGRFLRSTMSTEIRHGKFNRLSEMLLSNRVRSPTRRCSRVQVSSTTYSCHWSEALSLAWTTTHIHCPFVMIRALQIAKTGPVISISRIEHIIVQRC